MELWVNGKTLKYEGPPYGGLFHFFLYCNHSLGFLNKESVLTMGNKQYTQYERKN